MGVAARASCDFGMLRKKRRAMRPLLLVSFLPISVALRCPVELFG